VSDTVVLHYLEGRCPVVETLHHNIFRNVK